ncbi:unnamed protein product [Rotaria magnacalcarata]|uniref:G-protein coupled receptors family 1 profile domain-containing protein n=1 Tax=Rotaria magnacalcarata TaxID=392030 RepID=A0A816XSR3_9BILA|nr:unnamed protein product [Rotaria magnacalcarata]CAF3970357.1 unnamed protein product [Rotaria magnacalcarata]
MLVFSKKSDSNQYINNNNEADGDSFQNSEISLPRVVRFWILILLDVPSVACTLFLLFHLIVNRTLRREITNHIIAILLVFGLPGQLIDIALYLTFINHAGIVTPTTPATCLIWWVATFGFYNGGTILMAWAAIERYILVYHDRLVSTFRKRLLVHYLPLLIIILYTGIFYGIVIFVPPCENIYNYKLPICNAYPCYQSYGILGMWEFGANNIAPTVAVAVFSILLLVRVSLLKRRLHQRTQWRKQRRMAIQLLSISSLNLIFNMPLNILALAHLCGLPSDVGFEVEQYFYFSCYFLVLLFPFVCLYQYPNIHRKLFCRRKNRSTTIGPANAVINAPKRIAI